MRELLDLLALRPFRLAAHTGRAVMLAAGHGDEDILVRPADSTIDLDELIEVHLELCGATGERRPAGQARIDLFAQTSQVLGRAGKAISECIEGQLSEEALRRLDVIGRLGIDEEMAIDPVALDRSEGQAQLDIWKDQIDARQTIVAKFGGAYLLISVEQIVVRNAQRADLGRRRLDPGEIVCTGVGAFELVVENRSGCMNMRLPTKPA